MNAFTVTAAWFNVSLQNKFKNFYKTKKSSWHSNVLTGVYTFIALTLQVWDIYQIWICTRNINSNFSSNIFKVNKFDYFFM